MNAMKKKIILTVVLLALGWLVLSSYRFAYAPLTAATTAAQMDDTTSSFLRAKFIRDGGVEWTLFWITVVAVAAVWAWPKSKNSTTTQNEKD
jgi:hypothetical protein